MTDSKAIAEEIRVLLALIDQYELLKGNADQEHSHEIYYQGKIEGLLIGLGSLKRLLEQGHGRDHVQA